MKYLFSTWIEKIERSPHPLPHAPQARVGEGGVLFLLILCWRSFFLTFFILNPYDTSYLSIVSSMLYSINSFSQLFTVEYSTSLVNTFFVDYSVINHYFRSKPYSPVGMIRIQGIISKWSIKRWSGSSKLIICLREQKLTWCSKLTIRLNMLHFSKDRISSIRRR